MPDLQAVRELRVGRYRVLVDGDIYVWARKVHWGLHKSDTRVYVAYEAILDSRKVRVFLHRIVLGLAPDDPRGVDHINGDTLDNRRSNLRIATTAQNAQNQGSRGGSSRYRGVTWDRSRGKWMASGTLNGRRYMLGRFASEDDAGAAAVAWRTEHMPFSQDAQEAAR